MTAKVTKPNSQSFDDFLKLFDDFDLNTLSDDELEQQIQRLIALQTVVEKRKEKKKDEALDAIEELMDKHGISFYDICSKLGTMPEGDEAKALYKLLRPALGPIEITVKDLESGKHFRQNPQNNKHNQVPPKYKCDGVSWSGRGVAPKPIQAYCDRIGISIKEFKADPQYKV